MGAAGSAETQAAPIKPGDKVPAVMVHDGFIPKGGKKVSMADLTASGKFIVMGLPGAFTPCWSGVQIPGYLEKIPELQAKGVSKVLVYCANDGAMMKAWAKDQKTEGTMIEMYGDPDLEFTKACGMVMVGAPDFLGRFRCKRSVMIVENGVVKTVVESYEKGCEPGDCDAPGGPIVSKTLVEAILSLL